MSLRLATIHCDVPIPFEIEALRVQEPEAESLKTLYKELEFFSHLKELGPSEDVRPRDFAPLETADAVRAFVESAAPGEALSIAFSTDLTEIGLALRPAEARSLPATRLRELDFALKNPALPKAAHDLKSLKLFLLKRGFEARKDCGTTFRFTPSSSMPIPQPARSKQWSSAGSTCEPVRVPMSARVSFTS